MFGYRAEDLLTKRRRERWEAQKMWPFLTEHDLRSIKSTSDLSAIVSARKHISPAKAQAMVQTWMTGHWDRLRNLPLPVAPAHWDRQGASVPERPDW